MPEILYSLGFHWRNVERQVDVLIHGDSIVPIYMTRTDPNSGSEIWRREGGLKEMDRICRKPIPTKKLSLKGVIGYGN